MKAKIKCTDCGTSNLDDFTELSRLFEKPVCRKCMKKNIERKTVGNYAREKGGEEIMDRIESFFEELEDGGLSSYDIAAGLGNGDIEVPEWMSISESTDHLKAWDNETTADQHLGFVTINQEGRLWTSKE